MLQGLSVKGPNTSVPANRKPTEVDFLLVGFFLAYATFFRIEICSSMPSACDFTKLPAW